MSGVANSAAARLYALGIIASALHAELKQLATELNAFSDAPAGNPVSPALTRMYRAASFCGFWGVANYLGALKELALGIESNPPLSVDRTEYLERVKTLASGINALGLHLREISDGGVASYTVLNEWFARVIRKARPALLELSPQDAAPLLFMPAPPSLEVDATWSPQPTASLQALRDALQAALRPDGLDEPALRRAADSNPFRTLAGLFETAACQAPACLAEPLVGSLRSEFGRILEAIADQAPPVPPTPDAFLFSRLLFALATDESGAPAVAAMRKRYAMVRPAGGSPALTMHDVARRFSAGMVKFRDAYLQSALSNTPSPVKKLAASVFKDAHKLESSAFSTLAASLNELTAGWSDGQDPGFADWTLGAALLLLMQDCADNWSAAEAQQEMTGVANLMAATRNIEPCETLQLAVRIAALRKACAAIGHDCAELKRGIETTLRSLGEDCPNESQLSRIIEVTGPSATRLMRVIASFCVCVGLPRGAVFAESLLTLLTTPASWATSTERERVFDGLSRVSLFIGRLRPGSLIDIQDEELGEFAVIDAPAHEPTPATLALTEPAAVESPQPLPEPVAAASLAPHYSGEPAANEVMPEADEVMTPAGEFIESTGAQPDVVAVQTAPVAAAADDAAAAVSPMQGYCINDAHAQAAPEPVQPEREPQPSAVDGEEQPAPVAAAEPESAEPEPFDLAAGADTDFAGDFAGFEVAPARSSVAAVVHADPQVLLQGFLAAAADFSDNLCTDDPELLHVMFDESEQCLTDIGNGLGLWLQDAPADELVGTVTEMRRHVHTLKGVARTSGLLRVGAMLHALEDALDEMPDDGVSLAATLSAYVSAMVVVRDSMDNARSLFDASLMAPAATSAAETTDSAETAGAVEVGETAEAAVVTDASGVDPAPVAVAEAQPEPESEPEVQAPIESLSANEAPAPAPAPQSVRAAAPAPARTDGSVRVPLRLAGRVGDASGQVLMASRRSLEVMERALRNLRELEANLKRMHPALRELDILAAANVPSSAAGSSAGFDALELDRYTALQELVRRLKEAYEDSAGSTEALADSLRSMQGAEQERAQLSDDLQRESSALLLVSVATQRARLERVVAKACEDTGKQASLVIDGACRVPAAALDKLMPVFEHLLRNAVAHGIETAAARAASNKPVAGVITIGEPTGTGQDGGVVKVSVRDDGAGIDHAHVLLTAQKRGLVPRGAKFSDAAICDLLFMPGFSTASSVSQLAGRGVGLDVVRSAASSLGGMVTVASRRGSGTEFTLTLPTDASSMSVVPVTARGYQCLLPLTLVARIVPVSGSMGVVLDRAAGRVTIGDESLELVDLSTRVPACERAGAPRRGRGHLVLMRESDETKAVLVDSVGAQARMVVRQLGPFVRDMPGMVAGTTMPNGDAGLVVNPLRLQVLSTATETASESARARHILVGVASENGK